MVNSLEQTTARSLLDYCARREGATRGLGCVTKVERVAVEGYGKHLRIETFGSHDTGARTTLVLGHTDTVHPRGSLAARPLREESGRVFAPGIFDMKSGCAVALEALRACDELRL